MYDAVSVMRFRSYDEANNAIGVLGLGALTFFAHGDETVGL